MTIAELRDICLSFSGVTEDIKWEHHLCFNVGNKMFMITSPDEFPVSASFKVSDDNFDLLCTREGITPAAYLARYKWVAIDDIARLSPAEWKQFALEAYQLIGAKLSAKVRKELNL